MSLSVFIRGKRIECWWGRVESSITLSRNNEYEKEDSLVLCFRCTFLGG